MPHKRRSVFFIPLVVAACSLLGGFYGPKVEAGTASRADDIDTALKTFARIYDAVEQNFADPVSPDKAIYKGAIPGMLRTLDPHSNFFDPRDFQLLREEQKGHYYGVGMTVQPRSGKTIVLMPFTGSPAYKAGIHPGDVIIQVNESSTANLTTTEVADLLKGPRGTPVKITILREGNEKPIVFNVIRDAINRPSVEEASWIRPGVAYVDINSFNETTSKELEENLRKLGENNIKGLVLDLRNNPGGLLNEGVAVADKFLQKNQTIVSHRGRASTEKPYVARHGNGGRDYPIVVLVNRNSASAAEIVAGALQDHDRGWILGENTFGKGLVQTVYPLSENTGLALTTAKYYTPSGRLIQRDYSHTSFLDYYYRRETDTKNLQDVKMTDSGRTVFGGGGITPDEKFVPAKLDRFQTDLKFRKSAFFNFSKRYFGTHDSKLPANWEPNPALMEEFHDFLLKEKIQFTEAEFAGAQAWIKQNLKSEMLITAAGIDESRKYDVETDPMVAKAVDALPKARALLENAKRIVAQRLAK